MIVSHIVAMSQNRVIGRDGGLPWHIPEDLKFFKSVTMGHAMIMGRKTWDSIGRALPGRLTIVVTRDQEIKLPDGVLRKPSIRDALNHCEQLKEQWGNECFIIGGGEIYRQSLGFTHRIFLTLVHKQIEGDTRYPELPTGEFQQIKSEPHLSGSLPFTFTVWERVAAPK